MKKKIYLALVLIAIICMISPQTVKAVATAYEMKAVWMTTVYSLDFPTAKNNIAAQKDEFINKLEQLKSAGINTVVVQVRPKADALYKSGINPWSDVLTGVQGKDPGYDPLAFMIEEAHKRGMFFHAWLNPYRITTSGTDINALCENHPARLHPDWIITYNNAMYYNPAMQEVKNHITATVEEIVKNYNIDGIDFDDYFYPSNYPLPPGEPKDGVVVKARIQNINAMIQQVYAAIKNINKNVLFGVSPSGIWKNSAYDPAGSATSGNQSYYSVGADTRTWIKNGWIDYVVPQIYWETGNKAADYETLVKWWSNEVKGTNVKLYIGQGIYRDVVVNEIDRQLTINRKYPEVSGSFYYGMKNLLANLAGCKDKITLINQTASIAANTNTNPNPQATSTAGSVQSAAKIATVTAKKLNIRSGSGLKYSVVAKVAKGTKVTIIATIPGWHNVKLANGKTGWASAEYIK